jgi:hypothetical protein
MLNDIEEAILLREAFLALILFLLLLVLVFISLLT